MKTKNRKRLNMLMVLFTIIVMSYQATGGFLHELAGVLLLLLFLCHNVINRRWYLGLAKGLWPRYRKVLLVVNLLTLLSMLLAMGTGIYVSQQLFDPLFGMRESYLVRPIHVAAGAWGTLLVSMHGGMHMKLPKQKNLFFAGITVASFLLGGVAFFVLDMPARLALMDTGAYWRYPGLLLFLANAMVMALFAFLASWLSDWLRSAKTK